MALNLLTAYMALNLLAMVGIAGVTAAKPRGELIFPPDSLHNHGSSLVEMPDGRILACWYSGSGECQADDVAIMGARLLPSGTWSKPFVMADTPGFPDMNPSMVVDPQKGKNILDTPRRRSHDDEGGVI